MCTVLTLFCEFQVTVDGLLTVINAVYHKTTVALLLIQLICQLWRLLSSDMNLYLLLATRLFPIMQMGFYIQL